MCRPSGPSADLIDAHVWMRRQEARLDRPLTLDDVPDELLAERGSLPLHRSAAAGRPMLCNFGIRQVRVL
jgi:hypothetical protein